MNAIPHAKDVTQDERVLAAVAHAASILYMFGVLIPVIVYITQRDKSRFVAFHALQALAFHLFYSIGLLLFSFVFPILILPLLFIAAFVIDSLNNDSLMFFFAFGFQIIILASLFSTILAYLSFGVIGAIFLLSQRNFHYPLFGKRLQRYVESPVTNSGDSPFPYTDRFDQLLAALLHLSAFTSYLGALNAFIVWITQAKRSAMLRFQALQAATLHGGVIAASMLFSFGLMFIWFGAVMVMIVLTSLPIASGSSSLPFPPQAPVVFIGLFAIYGLFIIGMLLYTGVYYLYLGLAGWGAWQVAKGRHFRYPFLGRRLENYLLANPILSENETTPT